MIEVLAPGPSTLIQDLGRPGLAALGVGASGAADAPSLRLSNSLVGNDENAACLEVTFGGLEMRFLASATVALAGAPCPARVTDPQLACDPARALAMNSPAHLRAGEILKLGTPTSGVRSYLAVRGGIAEPPVLGSRSTDVLSGIGPPALAAGQLLAVGVPLAQRPPVKQPPSSAPLSSPSAEPILRLIAGPRLSWFQEGALDALCAARYEVRSDSNRIALRLGGPPLHRAILEELPPEGLIAGALQVPPDGQPTLFLADHPVTGGYPVIAVVRHSDVPLAAQLRPGQTVRFARHPAVPEQP